MIYPIQTQKLSIYQWILITLFVISDYSHASEKCLFSVDLIRHGDRNPLIDIPKSPIVWEGPLGELTQAGVQRMNRLGKKLKKEYIEQSLLLPADYEPSTLYVRSTAYSRTQKSAQALLAGLYPSETIPIHSVPRDQEHLLLPPPSDNPFAQMRTDFWPKSYNDLKIHIPQWEEATGLKLNKSGVFIDLADHLLIRYNNSLKMPVGMEDTAYEIIALGRHLLKTFFEQPTISLPAGSKILHTVKNYFDQRIHEKTSLRSVIYVAHDTTMMATLKSLGAKVKHPTYASRLNFKLFQTTSGHEIKVSYNGKLMHLPFCHNGHCHYADFLRIFSHWHAVK